MKPNYQEGRINEFRGIKTCIKDAIKNGEYSSNDVKFGISGNTFRALTDYENGPSEIYRLWADKITKLILKTEVDIADQQCFDKLHKDLCCSLKCIWENIEKKKELKFAHQYKMVDLYFKWLCTNIDWLCINTEWQKKNKEWIKSNSPYHRSVKGLSDQILKFGHCPLDKNSLSKFNKCSPKTLKIKNPSNPSMGSICNKEIYAKCQCQIKNFAEYCGGTPLLFDFYVWPLPRRWILPGKGAAKKLIVW